MQQETLYLVIIYRYWKKKGPPFEETCDCSSTHFSEAEADR